MLQHGDGMITVLWGVISKMPIQLPLCKRWTSGVNLSGQASQFMDDNVFISGATTHKRQLIHEVVH